MDTTAEREAFGEVVAILTLVAAVTVGVILLFLSPEQPMALHGGLIAAAGVAGRRPATQSPRGQGLEKQDRAWRQFCHDEVSDHHDEQRIRSRKGSWARNIKTL